MEMTLLFTKVAYTSCSGRAFSNIYEEIGKWGGGLFVD